MPRRGVRFPSGAELLGANHLPWALPRILHAIAKRKRPARGNGPSVGRGPGSACSRDASGAFTPNTRDSTIAAAIVGKRRGSGRSGKPGGSTGPRRLAKESGTGKASATGSASKSENRLRKKRFQKPRGSSLRTFFDGCCDRPGCYECFVRSRRSPRQRFCSHACRRAMECVWERERRWRRRRGRVPHLGQARPRARQP